MKKFAILMTASGALVLSACHAGTGSAAAQAKPPIAHVDGQPVSAEALDLFVKAQGGKAFAELPPAQQEQVAVSYTHLTLPTKRIV